MLVLGLTWRRLASTPIRRYGPPLNAAFWKWPSSKINCPTLAYDILLRVSGHLANACSENERHPSFSFTIVNWMELYIVFRCVKNSDNFHFFMITKVSSTYLFHKRGGSVKVSKGRVSMFSLTTFAITNDTGCPLLFQKLVCSVFHENKSWLNLSKFQVP